MRAGILIVVDQLFKAKEPVIRWARLKKVRERYIQQNKTEKCGPSVNTMVSLTN